MPKIYAIGVGGSGAKCIEAVTFLHAIGVYGNNCELNVLLIDADPTNGNLTRTEQNITKTTDCYRYFQKRSSPFMAEKVKNWGVWNPLERSVGNSFEQMLELRLNDPLRGVFEVLYGPNERVMDFDVGFRGRPPVGSAILGTLGIDGSVSAQQTPLERMLNDIQSSEGATGTFIHLFGSIFGGTGASGVPSLAKLIKARLQNDMGSNIETNTSILLPYFDFEKPPEEEKVFAEKRFFSLNTQAALKFLYQQSQHEKIFKDIYIIGNSASKTYNSKTGGEEQKNDAHFVELYAALALKDVMKRRQDTLGVPLGEDTQVHYICRRHQDHLVWEDFPDGATLKKDLGGAVRVAYMWAHNFSLELQAASRLGPKQFAIGAPWFPRFFDIKGIKAGANNKKLGGDAFPTIADDDQIQALKAFDIWADAFLLWAKQLSKSHHRGDRLFNLSDVKANAQEKAYKDKLSKLVTDQPVSPEQERQDCVDTIKNTLADLETTEIAEHGVVGLVHTLFNQV